MNRPTRITGVAAALAVATATFVLSALPAFGDDSGQLELRITVAGPCLTVGPGSGVVFPSKPFSITASSPQTTIAVPNHTLTNCGDANEKLYVKGSNATGSGQALWTLGEPKEVGTNAYALKLASTNDAGQPAEMLLLPDLRLAASWPMPGGASRDVTATLLMPTTGSDGAGQTMSITATYVVTF